MSGGGREGRLLDGLGLDWKEGCETAAMGWAGWLAGRDCGAL